MNHHNPVDAVVVGSGPNGLAAAVTLAQRGLAVRVYEAHEEIGGGTRTAELTLPGFLHDVCSSVHPLGAASPVFQQIGLEQHGLTWIQPPSPVAHPLDDGTAVMIERSIDATAEGLGPDREAYCRRMLPLVSHWPQLRDDLLGPPPYPPRHPLLLARFGLDAIWPAAQLAQRWFKGERARAVFAGMAAHSMLPLDRLITGGFALTMLVLAHTAGYPVARGGSRHITDALSAVLQSLGGEILTGHRISDLQELPPAHKILLDITPRQLLALQGISLPPLYKQQMKRYRYGPGIFKLDLAIDGPIPWTAEACQRSTTVHLGGTLDEIAASEQAVWQGQHPEAPFVILAQSSLFDPTRAPQGKHTVWAYCHTPSGSRVDMTQRIIAQIERFAPGFQNRILAVHPLDSLDMEQYNANYVGGDINGGVQDLRQFFTRPGPRFNPYAVPVKGVYLCSSATPPGGGVHGMCGYHAAYAALSGYNRR
jgi:phytoene dehydrogenase-like protein